MFIDIVNLRGLVLAVFSASIAVGRFIEKIKEHLDNKNDHPHRPND